MGEVEGRMNTVRAFSRESQCVVRRALWAWKLERSVGCGLSELCTEGE